mgnify:CR=1 FL=1
MLEEMNTGENDSKTNEVKQYYIRSLINDDVYILVDTPGFLDTRGANRDVETTKQI